MGVEYTNEESEEKERVESMNKESQEKDVGKEIATEERDGKEEGKQNIRKDTKESANEMKDTVEDLENKKDLGQTEETPNINDEGEPPAVRLNRKRSVPVLVIDENSWR